MRVLKRIKTLLIAVVCNVDNTCFHEDWESYYSNIEERRTNKIRESNR